MTYKNKIKPPFFTPELSDEDYLWRYFDLKGFLYLITMKSIYFSRVDKFEDANEGVDLRLLMEKKMRKEKYGNRFLEVGKLIMSDSANNDNQELNQRKYFVSCWHQNAHESPLMWSIYSNPEGIAVRIKYKDMKRLFSNAYINWTNPEDFHLSVEKIRYINVHELIHLPDEEIQRLNKVCLFKEIGYKYEHEVRIVAKSHEELFYNGQEITSIDILLKDTRFECLTGVFHPKSSQWFQRTIREIAQRLGVFLELRRSSLEFR
ncbi:hypothetical protein RCC89_04825 [Cytophagaceae bacterium ABcell3]|nr:hypothetical protein RCC89_04825 [Cytophagaceae bacterium ABcell3]